MAKTIKPQGIEVSFNVKKDVRTMLLAEDADWPVETVSIVNTYKKGEERTLPNGTKDKRKRDGFSFDHPQAPAPFYMGAADIVRAHQAGKIQACSEVDIDDATGEGTAKILPSFELGVRPGRELYS